MPLLRWIFAAVCTACVLLAATAVAAVEFGSAREVSFADATQWVLDLADELRENRESDTGLIRNYSWTTDDWVDIADGTKKNVLVIMPYIEMYKITKDVLFLDAAYQVRAESYSGSLEPGKRADFIVLDRNLFEIPEDDLLGTRVLKTVLDGREVFSRPSEN